MRGLFQHLSKDAAVCQAAKVRKQFTVKHQEKLGMDLVEVNEVLEDMVRCADASEGGRGSVT